MQAAGGLHSLWGHLALALWDEHSLSDPSPGCGFSVLLVGPGALLSVWRPEVIQCSASLRSDPWLPMSAISLVDEDV